MDKYKERLHNEILVDCKDEYEQNMSWFYYAQDELKFPFSADFPVKRKDGTSILQPIRAIELASGDSNFDRNFDLKVNAEFGEYLLEIPLGKLENIEADEETIEIIATWKYWVK